MIHDSVLDLIGHTPTVRLQRISVENGSEILVKLEACNPGRSIKDRTALFMVQQAEQRGHLRPNGTIIESTSGNIGKSLALIGAVKGYQVILVVDPKAPRSVIEFATACGAKIVMVDTPDPQGGYQRMRLERVKQIIHEDPDIFWPDQYNNPDNPRTHAEYTASEILGDVPHFDMLVASVSTGGHISGLSWTLKGPLPELVTIGVDAVGSAAFGYPFHRYVMRGLGLAWAPRNLDRSLVDRVHRVTDYEGIATSRILARDEGLFVGESSGAAVFSALHHAHQHPGSRIVVVAADDGTNYLGESFNEEWLCTHNLTQFIDNEGLTDRQRLIEAAREPAHRAVVLEKVNARGQSDRNRGIGAHPTSTVVTSAPLQ